MGTHGHFRSRDCDHSAEPLGGTQSGRQGHTFSRHRLSACVDTAGGLPAADRETTPPFPGSVLGGGRHPRSLLAALTISVAVLWAALSGCHSRPPRLAGWCLGAGDRRSPDRALPLANPRMAPGLAPPLWCSGTGFLAD